MAIYKAVQALTRVVIQSSWEEFDTDNQNQWEALKARADESTVEDLSGFPDKAPSDPSVWFELFQKLYHLDYQNKDADDWVSDLEGTTKYVYELRDSNDKVIDSA